MSNVPLAIFLSLPTLKMAGFRNSEWKDDLIKKISRKPYKNT